MNKQNDSKDERRNKTTKRNNYKTYLTFAIILHIGAQLYYSYLQVFFFKFKSKWKNRLIFDYLLIGVNFSFLSIKSILVNRCVNASIHLFSTWDNNIANRR